MRKQPTHSLLLFHFLSWCLIRHHILTPPLSSRGLSFPFSCYCTSSRLFSDSFSLSSHHFVLLLLLCNFFPSSIFSLFLAFFLHITFFICPVLSSLFTFHLLCCFFLPFCLSWPVLLPLFALALIFPSLPWTSVCIAVLFFYLLLLLSSFLLLLFLPRSLYLSLSKIFIYLLVSRCLVELDHMTLLIVLICLFFSFSFYHFWWTKHLDQVFFLSVHFLVL